MNKVLIIYMLLFTNLAVYGNDSILVDKIWTERQTIFVNEAQIDSILDDSVTEYYGIGCGYGRCKKIYFFSDNQFRKIDVDGDTLHGKWKLEGELLTIRYNRKYRGHKRNNRFIIKYRKKNYPTIYMFIFKKKLFDCLIFCNYSDERILGTGF
ncbi:MAG: hypothetical protein IK075_06850 [Prevotella sp.]|nr:hypothetical protein [Prevotella sp.]